MVVKMSINDIRRLFIKIKKFLDSESETSADIIYAMNKTKHKIKKYIDESDDVINGLQKEEQRLIIEYCEKDKDGKPKLINNDYCGLNAGVNSDYDTKAEELSNKIKEYLKEEVEVEIHCIKKEFLPKKGKASDLDLLYNFIEE